jgi:hypothetical protein
VNAKERNWRWFSESKRKNKKRELTTEALGLGGKYHGV